MADEKTQTNKANTSSEDLESMLTIAEKLQEQLDNVHRRVSVHRATTVVLALNGCICAVFLILWSNFVPVWIKVFTATGIVFSAIGLLMSYFNRDLPKQLRRDTRALGELVEYVREVYTSVAISEGWSPIKKAEYRIRLSRFDIGPSQTPQRWAPEILAEKQAKQEAAPTQQSNPPRPDGIPAPPTA